MDPMGYEAFHARSNPPRGIKSPPLHRRREAASRRQGDVVQFAFGDATELSWTWGRQDARRIVI